MDLMSKKRFNLLVFDWDGTLIDSLGRIIASFQLAIADLEMEKRSTVQIREIIGLGLEQAIATLFPQASSSQCVQLAERYRHHFLSSDLKWPTPLFAGVRETLHVLMRQGYWLAVATGKSRHGLDQALAQTSMTDFFHTTRCADETRSKPSPQMLQEIMEELGVSSAKTLMIGDSKYDLQMANHAGISAVAVCSGVQNSTELLRYNPLILLNNVPDLPTWLDQL
jgi:phosphoglycolate phosphatase